MYEAHEAHLAHPAHQAHSAISMLDCPDDFHRGNGSFSAFKKQVWSTNRCVLLTFFSAFNMDRWTDQQAYFPIEMQFYIFVKFLGFPDKIHEEKPSFLDFENNWLRTDGRTDGLTDGQTDPLIEMRGRI